MLESALVLDAQGNPIRHRGRTRSTDWDEVEAFCKTVYMPYRVRPLDRFSRPDATMISVRLHRLTLTRFSYGTGIHLDRFDPDAGRILVLNTLRGTLRHDGGRDQPTTRAGESLVVDCSRTEYWLDGDADHMQLNLTLSHRVMEEMASHWFGFVPDDALWTARVKFGGPHSAWLSLLHYVTRSLESPLRLPPDGPLAHHLEEALCVALLRDWAAAAGVRLDEGARAAAPHYVRRAEEIFAAEAREAPTVGDVARRLGISARTLSGGFRRFRGLSPRAFLAARRLEGLRADLETAPADRSVAGIAADWGFVNFGALAGQYRRRFGELPSHTRARARRSS